MSKDRDRKQQQQAKPGASSKSQAIAPGRMTLTERLSREVVPPKPTQNGKPAGTATPGQQRIDASHAAPMQRSRDVGVPGDEHDGHAATAHGAHGGGAGAAPAAHGGDAGVAHRGDAAAMVVSSAGDSEVAFDGSFTPALVAELQAHPELGLDDALRQIAATSLGPGGQKGAGLHHPTILQYGQGAQGSSEPRDHKKHAILIANQNYRGIGRLGAPIAETAEMKGELASRGYDATVHSDKSAADMSSLWTSMVGAANHGDDLVAHYSGHGAPEGLLGINHRRPPGPPDLFSNAQVSGVVSSATGKGAHIRFVMDSCYSGSAVHTVRKERQNELAAIAGPGNELRVAAIKGLHDVKAHLLAHNKQRDAILRQLDAAIVRHRTRVPDPAHVEARQRWQRVLQALHAAVPAARNTLDRAADRMWAAYVPLLDTVKTAVRHREAPPPRIVDYHTLGAQINYLDDLWNATSQPTERMAGRTGGSAPTAR